MDLARYYVPTTDQPDPDAMAPRPALASLTKNKRVKLRLSDLAFGECCQVVTVLVNELSQDVDRHPWLDEASVRSRAGLVLLLDLYEAQLQPFVLASPNLVTLTMSRCEAHDLWHLWVLLDIPASAVPAFTQVMHELHHLLS